MEGTTLAAGDISADAPRVSAFNAFSSEAQYSALPCVSKGAREGEKSKINPQRFSYSDSEETVSCERAI